MRKIIILGFVLSLIIAPLQTLASPGPVDQYGGHSCTANCDLYNLTPNSYHYHAIPPSPDYLVGYALKPSESYLYFLPLVKINLLTKQQATITDAGLAENSALDNKFCGGLGIFAKGYYTKDNLIRVKPVCADKETVVMFNTKVITNIYYKEIPSNSPEITKLYHYLTIGFKKDVITDRPDLSELSGKLIQGSTDPALYYVKATGADYELSQISANGAASMFGNNYKDQVLYFDDSIVYTYKIGQPLP